ncbi:MAG TPA: DUF559 domain-containing protein [Acidimicrobiales bacterium]|nr:DUF559 domain-containing protein [Acidimicrobiales bacterium]
MLPSAAAANRGPRSSEPSSRTSASTTSRRDSELEDLFLEVCAAFGIEAPDGQINLGTKDRWVGRVDFVWRRAKVIAEIDGSQHRAPLDRRSDRRRDCDLGGEGWTVIRITWWQLVHEPESVVARLRAHLSFSRWQRAHSAR